MLKTAICNLFGIQYPIVQGGMAYLATAELASAVSNAGGLGVVAAANHDANWLRQQIQITRKLTTKPFGINIFLPSRFIKEQVRIIVEEKVPVVITGGGNPGLYLSQFKQVGIKVMPVIASVDQARKVELSGADALIAEGMEAGGHIGASTTLSLIPQVADIVGIPVVAAGGIADGRGMVAALALGAQGIQMGTRFICSEECVASPRLKNKILKSNDRGTTIIGGITGHPVRCLSNRYSRNYSKLEKAGATPEELELIIRGRFYSGVVEGNIDEGLLMAGQISGLIKDVKPVKAIIDEIMGQAENILTLLSQQFRTEGCGV